MSEEIIIDGVNVAECEYYFKDNGVIAPDGTSERTDICTSPEHTCENNDSCYCNKDCYYKQLQRLKQENEELKEKINSYICSANCYKYKEAEKYKQALEEIRDIVEEQCKYNCGISLHNCYDKPRIDCLFYRIKTKIEQVSND